MRHIAPLPSVVMVAATPVTYAEYYRVVTNDPHEGDRSAVYKYKTPVPVGGIRPTPANIVTSVYGDSNPDAYLLLSKGGGQGPLRAHPPAGHNVSTQSRMGIKLCGGADCAIRGRAAPCTHLCVLTGPGLPCEKAVVPVVAQMAPAYAAREGAEKLLGPFATIDANT